MRDQGAARNTRCVEHGLGSPSQSETTTNIYSQSLSSFPAVLNVAADVMASSIPARIVKSLSVYEGKIQIKILQWVQLGNVGTRSGHEAARSGGWNRKCDRISSAGLELILHPQTKDRCGSYKLLADTIRQISNCAYR
jgi:hypothetical protein